MSILWNKLKGFKREIKLFLLNILKNIDFEFFFIHFKLGSSTEPNSNQKFGSNYLSVKFFNPMIGFGSLITFQRFHRAEYKKKHLNHFNWFWIKDFFTSNATFCKWFDLKLAIKKKEKNWFAKLIEVILRRFSPQ